MRKVMLRFRNIFIFGEILQCIVKTLPLIATFFCTAVSVLFLYPGQITLATSWLARMYFN